MDAMQDLEEELREASCVGDMESLKTLVEVKHVNVNSQNKINGWLEFFLEFLKKDLCILNLWIYLTTLTHTIVKGFMP